MFRGPYVYFFAPNISCQKIATFLLPKLQHTFAASVEIGFSSKEAEDDLQHFRYTTFALLRHSEEYSVEFIHLERNSVQCLRLLLLLRVLRSSRRDTGGNEGGYGWSGGGRSVETRDSRVDDIVSKLLDNFY